MLASVCLAHGLPFSVATFAQEAPLVVKCDGTTVFLPEVRLTRPITPVTKFLFLGAHETRGGAGGLQKPLCAIDANSNTIRIEAPERLLEGSRTRVVTRNGAGSFIDSISYAQHRALTCVAFKIKTTRRQSVVIETAASASSSAALFHNGKLVGAVSADNAKATGGRCYFPVILEPEPKENVFYIQQQTVRCRPQFQMAVISDNSRDMLAAFQPKNGLLKKLIFSAGDRPDPVILDWHPNLAGFRPALEIRDLSTGTIIFKNESSRRRRINVEAGVLTASSDGRANRPGEPPPDLPPGIYEASYRTENERASELFMVGDPRDLFAEFQERLSHYNPDPESKLDIEAQLRRARILLSKENYNVYDRQFQEKLAYTFASLAGMEYRLKGGATNLTKNQPGLHVRGFVSRNDNSEPVFYRLYIPTTLPPGQPLPLLVIPSTPVRNSRPFIEGPAMADHRSAVCMAKQAERHGFAILWPGYRGSPNGGYSYESSHIIETIQAVLESGYNIDNQRINIYATCGAGYGAGRLVSEYSNYFSAIVYDQAVFDLSLERTRSSMSLMEWYATVNPSRHVINNKNLKIFVMHDNTTPPGHGPLVLTTAFLSQAAKTRNDVVSYISERPMTPSERMEMVFSWLASVRNENPNDKRSYFLAKAGYTGPISEVFSTPFIVVEGTRAIGRDMQSIRNTVESFRHDYAKHFHGAKCAVKKDTEVTQDDIDTHSLILIGNPRSNSVWEKLQPLLSVNVTSSEVVYDNTILTGNQPFQVVARNPCADGKYILMIGAGDLRTLRQATNRNLFIAWYDCHLFAPEKIISKLSKP